MDVKLDSVDSDVPRLPEDPWQYGWDWSSNP